MKKWEKSKKKLQLKAYQKVCLFVLLGLFLIATIICLVIYRKSIFTENTLVWIVLALFILFSALGTFLFWRINKK